MRLVSVLRTRMTSPSPPFWSGAPTAVMSRPCSSNTICVGVPRLTRRGSSMAFTGTGSPGSSIRRATRPTIAIGASTTAERALKVSG